MAKTGFAQVLTPEIRAKAMAARAAKVAEGAKYRRDFMDSDSWDQLAKSKGIRLPAWWVAPTPAALRKWSKRLVEVPFLDAFGCSPIRLIELNPTFPLRVFVGHMLEMAD